MGPANVLDFVTSTIREIDLSCQSLVNQIEGGLVNVRKEFRQKALDETGKKLSEETLIAWLIFRRIRDTGFRVDWERSYPGQRRKKCDLVVHLDENTLFWIEVKLAWKSWFECIRGPVLENPNYESYLFGVSKTHSLNHDFEKLAAGRFQPWDDRVICLIGFDSFDSPMDQDVKKVASLHPDWELHNEDHWADRRCEQFRLNVWNWLRRENACPEAKS